MRRSFLDDRRGRPSAARADVIDTVRALGAATVRQVREDTGRTDAAGILRRCYRDGVLDVVPSPAGRRYRLTREAAWAAE